MENKVWIESRENYCKQSYRNRARILTGNGIQTLSIPVIHEAHNPAIMKVRIDYTTPWQRIHWRAIETAYNKSPYYLYYKDILRPYYEQHIETLFEFNQQLLLTLLKSLRIKTSIQLTDHYEPSPEPNLCSLIHPKRCIESHYPLQLNSPYYQVFEERFGFTPNLSIIDLIFNLGPESTYYLEALNIEFKTRFTSDGK